MSRSLDQPGQRDRSTTGDRVIARGKITAAVLAFRPATFVVANPALAKFRSTNFRILWRVSLFPFQPLAARRGNQAPPGSSVAIIGGGETSRGRRRGIPIGINYRDEVRDQINLR